MKAKVFGIATCQSCKKAMKWLEDNGIDFTWQDFREKSPSTKQVQSWIKAFGTKAMRNTSGGSYRALGEEKKSWSDKEWLEAFEHDPMLIKRPILEVDGKPSSVGFKSEKYSEMFGK